MGPQGRTSRESWLGTRSCSAKPGSAKRRGGEEGRQRGKAALAGGFLAGAFLALSSSQAAFLVLFLFLFLFLSFSFSFSPSLIPHPSSLTQILTLDFSLFLISPLLSLSPHLGHQLLNPPGGQRSGNSLTL